ncbi:hypothetical protein D3C87_1560240 [compost metagenome]
MIRTRLMVTDALMLPVYFGRNMKIQLHYFHMIYVEIGQLLLSRWVQVILHGKHQDPSPKSIRETQGNIEEFTRLFCLKKRTTPQ